MSSPSTHSLHSVARFSTALAAAALITTLVACADRKSAGAASQVVAKVNKEELSIHQVNHLLSRQQMVKPDQVDAASRQILERLIDQELAVQKAQELKVDRDPSVLQALESARREIIARAYLDRVSETASRPTASEVKQYFDQTPALFSERRIYQLQELSIEAKLDQLDVLRAQLKNSKSPVEYVQYLRSKEIRFVALPSVRPAEQLPLALLGTFAKMKDGDAFLTPTANGADVVFVVSAQSSPMDEATARPAIQQYLLNERKRQVVEKDIKALRDAGKVEYLGKFAAASAAAAVAVPAAPAIGASAAPTDVVVKRTSGLK